MRQIGPGVGVSFKWKSPNSTPLLKINADINGRTASMRWSQSDTIHVHVHCCRNSNVKLQFMSDLARRISQVSNNHRKPRSFCTSVCWFSVLSRGLVGQNGGVNFRFLNPQPGNNSHCETTDTGLVFRTRERLYPSQYWSSWTQGNCVRHTTEKQTDLVTVSDNQWDVDDVCSMVDSDDDDVDWMMVDSE